MATQDQLTYIAQTKQESRMDALRQLMKLQTDYRKSVAENNVAYENFINLLETAKGLNTRLKELQQQFMKAVAKIGTIDENNHGPFSPEHEYVKTETGYRIKWLPACSDCMRLLRGVKADNIDTEMHELETKRREVIAAHDRWESSVKSPKALLVELNNAGSRLGLPGFVVSPDGQSRVVEIGDILNFAPTGRVILERGQYIDYTTQGKKIRAVIDPSDNLVAYTLDDTKWHLTGLGPRHVQHEDKDTIVKVKGGYSIDHQVPTTDIVIIDPNDRSEHRHVVIDDEGNELFNKDKANKPPKSEG